MAGIMLNITCNDHERQEKGTGNAKHTKFVQKRRYLERRGYLNKKQGKRKRKDHPQASTVFSEFTMSHTEFSINSSSSMQAHHGNSVSIKEFTVPSKSTSETGSSSVLHNPMKYVALDCEMVGTGPKGHCSELARCSIVTYDGDVIYDQFIKPVNPVTDFRTKWSGIRWRDLQKATPFKQAQAEILKLIKERVVVGHAVQNDLKVLHYSHPVHLLRDTSRIPILNQKAGLPANQPASLKTLTKLLLHREIQTGMKGHCSVEDAKATMELYRIVAVEWEKTMASRISEENK